MSLSLDKDHNAALIQSYDSGNVIVRGQTLRHSFIITPDLSICEWRPTRFESITQQDLTALVSLNAELILIGTGDQQHFLPPELAAEFINRRIGYEVMTTPAACRTFNVLVSEKRQVAAAMLIP